jgi:aldose 1-epimerase
MAMAELVRLEAGRLRLQLSPSIGGSISAFEWMADDCARPILRNCNSPLQNVLDAACFPLVPYVNRIRGGQFNFRGREVQLVPNMPGDPSPLHGQGWLNAWEVEEASEDRAKLSYSHHAGEWPWDYEARQEFALKDRHLTILLTCRNTSGQPMPCGLGQHPYFHCGPETRIDTRVTHAWTIDEHVLPIEKVPADGRFDLRKRLICGQDLDNGFDEWDGLVWMGDPSWPYDLLLSSTSAGFFQLYSPPDGGIFVAEPVTHANAALNAPEREWSELGMRVLEPGQELRLDLRLEVVPK